MFDDYALLFELFGLWEGWTEAHKETEDMEVSGDEEVSALVIVDKEEK